MNKLLQMGSFKRWVFQSACVCVSVWGCTWTCQLKCTHECECLHVCKCMHIIWGRLQNESMSPLMLTALNLANHVELFCAELRPLTQQSSPLGDYSKSFPETKELGQNLKSHTHTQVLDLLQCCVSWKTPRAVGGNILQLIWKSNPRGYLS